MDPDACRNVDDPDPEFNYYPADNSDRCTRPIDLDYPQEDQDIDQTDHRPYLWGRVPLETHIPDFDHRLRPEPVPLWLPRLYDPRDCFTSSTQCSFGAISDDPVIQHLR